MYFGCVWWLWAKTRAQLYVKYGETQPCNLPVGDLPWTVCSRELVKKQKLGPSIKDLLNMTPRSVQSFLPLLSGKWMPQGEHHLGDTIYQMVVPQKSHKTVLLIAPDSGHLGVRKTYDCVLRHFRPHLKKKKNISCLVSKWRGTGKGVFLGYCSQQGKWYRRAQDLAQMSWFLAPLCEDGWQSCRIIWSRNTSLKIKLIMWMALGIKSMVHMNWLNKNSGSPDKNEKNYDRQTERCTFLPGDQVLVCYLSLALLFRQSILALILLWSCQTKITS